MEMPWSGMRRKLPRAWMCVAKPSAEVPAPSARPGSRLRAGSRAEAMPGLCTEQRKIPFRISWRSLFSAARAELLAVVDIRAKQGGPSSALHCGGVQGQYGEAEAVSEACLDLPKLKTSCGREGIQPGRGGAACTVEESGAGMFACFCAGIVGGKQGVCGCLGRMRGELSLWAPAMAPRMVGPTSQSSGWHRAPAQLLRAAH
jgi:hypothetical protein